tara:strand:+ start:346 stop:1095 length:750 start_codon:yes stop_codon:yes gene_type:complete
VARPAQRNKGPALSDAVKEAGLSANYELLLHAPHKYVDFTSVLTMERSFPLGKRVVLQVKVKQPIDKSPEHIEPVHSRFSDRLQRWPKHQMVVGDDKRSIWLYFGQRVTKGGFLDLAEGDELYVAGLLELKGQDYFIFNPEFAPAKWLGRIMPVYPHLKSISDRRRNALHKDHVRDEIDKLLRSASSTDRLSKLISKRLGERALPATFIKNVTRALHHPPSMEEVTSINQWIDDLGIRALLAEDDEPGS